MSSEYYLENSYLELLVGYVGLVYFIDAILKSLEFFTFQIADET